MKKIIKKIAKYTLFLLIAVVISLNLFVILSGRFYLYKGFYNTYLQGRLGPTIYDQDAFYNNTIDASEEILPFIYHPNYNEAKIPNDFRTYVEELKTRGFIVLKGDTLLYEEYWDDHDTLTRSNSFSVAKTVVSLLVGIAVDEGHIKSLDDPVGDYLKEFDSEEKRKLTIRHLLQMASGLDWTESGKDPLSDNAESYYGSDLYGQVVSQKLIEEPGKRFNYQSGNSQLLAFIVEKATGITLSEYAEKKIWKPLQTYDDAYWSLDKKDGDEKAFCCIYSTARDYAKIGLLLLNQGRYKGKQIIPKWYYDEMIVPGNLTTDQGVPNYRYGLHIWTYFGEVDPVYYCRGINGQYIITIPNQQLVIVRVGEDRKPIYTIPEHLKDDATYVKANEKNVGHNLGLFQYIALGKMIASQTK